MPLLTASKTRGEFLLPSGQVIKVEDVSQQVYYDSDLIALAPGATDYVFCRNANFSTGALKLQGIDYNLPEWGRVPTGWYYEVITAGFFVQAGIPSFDLQAIVNRGYMRFLTGGGQKTEQDGLLMLYPFGVGIGGGIALDGGMVANEASFGNIGSPASASIAPNKFNIDLPEMTSFETHVTFPGAPSVAPGILSAITQLYFAMKVNRFRPVQ